MDKEKKKDETTADISDIADVLGDVIGGAAEVIGAIIEGGS